MKKELFQLPKPINVEEKYMYAIAERLDVIIQLLLENREEPEKENDLNEEEISKVIEENEIKPDPNKKIEKPSEEYGDKPEDTIETAKNELYESMTKREIMDELDNHGVEYNSRDTKRVLFDLLMSLEK